MEINFHKSKQVPNCIRLRFKLSKSHKTYKYNPVLFHPLHLSAVCLAQFFLNLQVKKICT